MIWKTLFLSLFVAAVTAIIYDPLTQNKESLKAVMLQTCKLEDKDDALKAVDDFFKCLSGMENFADINNAFQTALANGTMLEFVRDYCSKTPHMIKCNSDLLTGMSPCLDDSTKHVANETLKMTENRVKFACENNAEKATLFITEKGVECYQSKLSAISECVQRASARIADNEALSHAQKACAMVDEMNACTVLSLKTCESHVPGNLAESLFRTERKAECNTILPKND